ncbi:MAG: D-alanyl-D-alanine carboxypeptidase [Gammaproteobacteria bacterium]|nr:D-alanyl-D-alanine carboxypeptidase [Gammaproteobacteria bacterium]
MNSFKAYRRLAVGVLCLALVAPAVAETPIPAPPQFKADGYLLIDYHTGRPLATHQANTNFEPASITKLMTAYVVFDTLKNKQINLSDEVTVSENAWRATGSRMFIEVGKKVRVDDLLQGLIVQSGNDAAIALAEYVGGSEAGFIDLMNDYANKLQLNDTAYANSTGLPADGHITTAADIAALTRHLIQEFPQYYAWYAQKEFEYNDIKQANRNNLLWRDDSVDGVKTGHTDSAGYCLVASAKRGEMRLISIVLGTPSNKARMDGSQALLDYGFRHFQTYKLFAAGEAITQARVFKGKNKVVELGLKQDLMVTVSRGDYEQLSASMDVAPHLTAPVGIDTSRGLVRVRLADQLITEQPLFALEPVRVGGVFKRAKDEIVLWFH